jgi:hypothetical protein
MKKLLISSIAALGLIGTPAFAAALIGVYVLGHGIAHGEVG